MAVETQDIVIVGAGVIGLSIAWRLLLRGARVTVVDRGLIGQGASQAAAGMLAPTAEVRFEETDLLAIGQQSLAMYPAFVAELEEATGLDVDYRREGTLAVGIDRDDAEALDHLYAYHRELDLKVERLSADEAFRLEPGLSPRINNALYIPDDHQVNPRRLTAALATAIRGLGGRIFEHTPVARLWREGDRVAGVTTEDGRRLEAPKVLVCAGAWSRRLEGLPVGEIPLIRPVRGQMLAIELGEPPLCRHVIRAPDAYLVPRSDGRLVIGATSEEVGFDERMTAGGVFELLRGAWESLPGVLESALLDMWTGFRPMTIDNLPVLGPSTTCEGLWYATGHGRGGILLTPWTAQTMVEALAGAAHLTADKPWSATRYRTRGT